MGPQNWLLATKRRSPAIAADVGHWNPELVVRETIRPLPYLWLKRISAIRDSLASTTYNTFDSVRAIPSGPANTCP